MQKKNKLQRHLNDEANIIGVLIYKELLDKYDLSPSSDIYDILNDAKIHYSKNFNTTRTATYKHYVGKLAVPTFEEFIDGINIRYTEIMITNPRRVADLKKKWGL